MQEKSPIDLGSASPLDLLPILVDSLSESQRQEKVNFLGKLRQERLGIDHFPGRININELKRVAVILVSPERGLTAAMG